MRKMSGLSGFIQGETPPQIAGLPRVGEMAGYLDDLIGLE
jgi:hypothetical protein